MRAALLLALCLAAPLAGAGAGDAREVVANRVLDARCPGLSGPAAVACFDVTGASSARVAIRPDVGNAQPRMIVQLQNATVLWRTVWMCEDGTLSFGGLNVTTVVVNVHDDRQGCYGDRPTVVAHGTLSVT